MKKLFILFTILFSCLCVACRTNVETFSDVGYEAVESGYKFFVISSDTGKTYILHDIGNCTIEYSDVFNCSNPEIERAEITWQIDNRNFSHGVRNNVPVLYLIF